MPERLAAALACLLTQEERDALRARRAPAREVLALFTFDHIALHAWGGSDRWHNLDPKRRGLALKKKDAADTSRAFKAKRIEEKWSAFTRAMARGKKPKRKDSQWHRNKRRPNTPTKYI
jgi:hypothetical protein